MHQLHINGWMSTYHFPDKFLNNLSQNLQLSDVYAVFLQRFLGLLQEISANRKARQAVVNSHRKYKAPYLYFKKILCFEFLKNSFVLLRKTSIQLRAFFFETKPEATIKDF